MAVITIQRGDTVSELAVKHGVKIQSILDANPSITNPDVIKAGDKLTIPDVSSGGSLKGTLPGSGIEKESLPTENPSRIGNFRIALKAALNEGAVRRQQARFSQIKPLLKDAAPGSFKGITSLIREGIKQPVEDVFVDIIEARERELELGELEVSTMGGFEILRNPLTGDIVSTRVVRERDEDLSISEKNAAREANISQYLNTLVGEDGFVAPETYVEAKNRWIAGGGTLASFKFKFPPELYLSEGSQLTLPESLREDVGDDLSSIESIIDGLGG